MFWKKADAVAIRSVDKRLRPWSTGALSHHPDSLPQFAQPHNGMGTVAWSCLQHECGPQTRLRWFSVTGGQSHGAVLAVSKAPRGSQRMPLTVQIERREGCRLSFPGPGLPLHPTRSRAAASRLCSARYKLRPWASSFLSLCLSFFICTMG